MQCMVRSVDPGVAGGHHARMPLVRSNGIELFYESLGEDEGEPLVLIMGFGAQMTGWHDDFCQMLVAQGFRVIRFDNRDVGLSTKLDQLGRPRRLRSLIVPALFHLSSRVPYTLDDMAADTIGLLDALGIERAHVVGASMGGMIAQIMAIRYPHRLRTLTSIMSHPGNLSSRVGNPAVVRALLAPVPREPKASLRHMVEIARLISGPGFPFDEAGVRRRLVRAWQRSLHPAGVARQLGAVSVAPSRVSALRAVRTPTLVIHGTHDPLVLPSGGRATARAIPGARLHWVQGMGHDMPRGAWPELVAAIADHVKAHASTRAAS